MSLALTLRSSTGSRHCLVSADPSTSVGGLFSDWDVPVFSGARLIDRAAPLADSPVRQGSILDLGARRPGPSVPAPGQLCLLVVAGPATGAWAPLVAGVTEVGRAAPIRLGDRSVSRTHFRLIVGDDGGLTVEDCGSRNGTQVDGKALAGSRPLDPGELISVGGSQLTVIAASTSAVRPGSVPSGRSPTSSFPARRSHRAALPCRSSPC